jgi:hypothetical protein
MPNRCDDICPTDAFLRLDQDNHAPFGDTIAELSGRAGFKPKERLETSEWSPPTSFWDAPSRAFAENWPQRSLSMRQREEIREMLPECGFLGHQLVL